MGLQLMSREHDDASPSWVTFTFRVKGQSKANDAELAQRYLAVIQRALEGILVESGILDYIGSDGNEFSFTILSTDVTQARQRLRRLPNVVRHLG